MHLPSSAAVGIVRRTGSTSTMIMVGTNKLCPTFNVVHINIPLLADKRKRQLHPASHNDTFVKFPKEYLSTVAATSIPTTPATFMDNRLTSASTDSSLTPLSSSDSPDPDSSYLFELYNAMVRSGQVQNDVQQLKALTELDRLRNDLVRIQGETTTTRRWTNESSKASKMVPNEYEASNSSGSIGDDEEVESEGFWSRLLSSVSAQNGRRRGGVGSSQATTSTWRFPFLGNKKSAVRGVYLHGGVGCGKTFCMDLFYDSITHLDDNGISGDGGSSYAHSGVNSSKGNRSKTWVSVPIYMTKQKVHFHEFMLRDVHRQMHLIKQRSPDLDADGVLSKVMDRIISRGRLLCFDEFQVVDVADALILRRLFTGLFERGAVMVITSNRIPSDLYLGGIQRDLFLPFIDLLEEKMSVVGMWDSITDYRLVCGKDRAKGVYFVGVEKREDFDLVFRNLTKGSTTKPTVIKTTEGGGRAVDIPCASTEYAVARFSFDDLCRQARGAADYLAIGQNFHTVFVENIPVLTMNEINLVRRLIVFIDEMYECRVKLIVHAAAGPSGLFEVDLENRNVDEAFAFDRTRSRLEEMRSRSYLGKRWIGCAVNRLE